MRRQGWGKPTRFSLSIAAGLFALAAIAGLAQAVEIVTRPVLPAEVTIVDTPNGPVLATKDGMTLYKTFPHMAGWGHAKDQAEVVGQCVYQCPTEYPPYKASADAKPVGDFTIVKAADGGRQWAYKGVALLTFKYDVKPGNTIGEDTYAFNGPRVPVGEAAWVESEIAPQQPAPLPPPTKMLPPGMIVQGGISGNRFYADAAGYTLYTYDAGAKGGACTGMCLVGWKPFAAGALSRGMGDWGVLSNEDGTRQWAYKGKPIYRFLADAHPGEAMGETTGETASNWHALIEYQAPLPREVTIGLTKYGPVYTEKKTGKTLYFQGFNHRPYQNVGFNHAPHLYGTINCYNECEKSYPPLLAPANAQAAGEWWVLTRVDGKKQWAWRGIPLYTYATDKPGETNATGRNHIWTEVIANNPSPLRLQ